LCSIVSVYWCFKFITAQCFLINWRLFSWSCIEPKGSLSYSQPLDPILSHCFLTPSFFKIHSYIVLPCTPVSSKQFFHACYMSCLIILDLITLVILCKKYKLWSTLCNFLHLVTLSLRSKCSQHWYTLNPCSSLRVRDQVSDWYKRIGCDNKEIK